MNPNGYLIALTALIAPLAQVATASRADASATGPPPGDSVRANSDSQPPAGEADLPAFAQCMRDNGIADFPDPDQSGIDLDGLGIDIDSPAFRAADVACAHFMPGLADRTDGWEQVVPGGDCECADGSEFSFWARGDDPSKVVFYLDGGGACFDAESCAFADQRDEDSIYDHSANGENPAAEGGMFGLGNPANPFAGYSFIYVPSCTGDMHLGDNTHEYSPDLTVGHNGFVNGSAALSYLAEHYPDATEVVVVGKTVGGFASPVYGGLIADLLPDARVTVLAMQSGGMPDTPELVAEVFGEQWGAYATMPEWEVNAGLAASDWGPTQFWIQAGLHAPEITFARFDYAYDRNAAATVESMTGEDDLLSVIDANEATIENAGVVQHSYTAPGDTHGIVEFDSFYELEVNGVKLVDWVAALLAGEPLDDVHCDDCKRPEQ